ncbi:hypothetical protein ACFL47_03680, partial [Candidatus Latescibacterota bacterium]
MACCGELEYAAPPVILALMLMLQGCGQTASVTPREKAQRSNTLTRWLGEYDGTIVYTYGDITDKKGHEGFPASLALRDVPDEILFELIAHHSK